MCNGNREIKSKIQKMYATSKQLVKSLDVPRAEEENRDLTELAGMCNNCVKSANGFFTVAKPYQWRSW